MNVHSFESLAALDGDGIRFCVFLSGCPLKCAYCHNPDTQTGRGTSYTKEELLKKIIRYKPYFKRGGGVTFSGGEPLLQAKGINELYPLLKDHGIEYALDTSGAVALTEDVKTSLKNSSLVICDLKFCDKDSFFKYAKGDFSLEKNTLDFLKSENIRTWIRTVIVPGINDDNESVKKYAELVATYPNAEKYELLPFHTMGFFKYEEGGFFNPLKDTPPMDTEKLKSLQSLADEIIKNRPSVC